MLDMPFLADLSVEEKRELLKNLLSLRSPDPAALVPLSYGQQSLWFVYKLAPQSPAYNFLYAARIGTALDVPLFRRAFQALLHRHLLLRTRFVMQDRTPRQQVDPQLVLDLPVTDASACSEEHLLEAMRRKADQPFDLETGPPLRIELFRRSPAEAILLVVFHHLVADLWSMDLLLRELQQVYAALLQGREPELPPLPAQFTDFVRGQLLSVHGPGGQKAWAYWRRLLAGELPVLNLPTDRPRPPVQTYNGTAFTWPLRPPAVQRLRALLKGQQVTPYAALLAVLQLLLHRLSGQSDFLVGTAVADRRRPEYEQLVGYLLNQVVFRADFSANPSFRALLDHTRDQVLQALDHQDFPFGLIVRRLQPRRDASRSPLFQVMFVWDKPHTLQTPWGCEKAPPAGGQALPLETLVMEQRGAPFDLTLVIFETGERLTASFRYNTDLFNSATIERFAGYFDTLLSGVLESPDAPVSEAPLLSEAERRRLLVDWNQTGCPYPRECGFHQLFERQAERSPQAVALDFEDRTLSYSELNRRANQLARHLQALGVRRGHTVAISLPRGPDLIAAVLAVWKAGAAYLFLEPAYPARRLAAMTADSQPAALISSECSDLSLPNVRLAHDGPVLGGLAEGNLDLPVSEEDQAYLIYTSGSTGQPKGTILRHGGLCNFTESVQRYFRVQPRDRVLQFASLSFDASVFEMALAFPAGAALVLATQASLLPGPGLLRLLRDKAVTMTVLPPSVLAMLPPQPLPALRAVIVGGESCSAELVAAWAPGRQFFNVYGPTETTVWVSVAECVADGRAPTIGRPGANTRFYVLDDHLQLVPFGVTGELYVAGPGLARGYLNQPELTAERFLPNPFDEADGAVLYRTGDLVRWTEGGELEFCGRRDRQVKVRGYRIELEEIQEVLRRNPEVADAVLVARAEGEGPAALAAYVVPRCRETFSPLELSAYLRERLPHYMLPSLTTLEAFPFTPSGKVDHARLPAPSADPRRGRPVVEPRTPTENLLASIWAQVLNVEQVGSEDNFFDLGGASIQTLEVVSLANARGLSLSPEMLFRHQTIAELAGACDRARPGRGTNGPPPQDARVPAPVKREEAAPVQQAPGGGALIESIGTYLPARAVTTGEILKQCRAPLDFPLERLTGIRSRRVAGDTEFSLDLAEKAVADCLSRSAHSAGAIDLLICCNISRCDGPDYQISFEPTSAARLRKRFGLVNAVAFDISNACAGTFTALNLVDAFLRHGVIRRALVVSGEYITHLTATAQREIESFMDSRLACLTVGDSGLALLLERAPNAEVGFHDIEMYTLGKYHDLCVAKATTQPHGGAIMYTDPLKSSAVAIKQITSHAVECLRRNQWPPETVDLVVMHQTSETTLDGAVHEINRALGKGICHRGNTVYNVAERGNTATTSHFLAIRERIQAGRLEPGSRVLFAISGSGQTVGTALYTFDDLPARASRATRTAPTPAGAAQPLQHYRCSRPIRIESVGTVASSARPALSQDLLLQAGEACLQTSARPRDEIDLVIHTGVYRSEFLSEPALAAIAAGLLAINHDEERSASRRTLAFDLRNGAAGTLTACFVACQLLAGRKFSRTLLLASEVENNSTTWPDNLLGIRETASGMTLEESAGEEGFTAFAFRWFPEEAEAIVSYTVAHDGQPALSHRRDPGLDRRLLDCIRTTVTMFLDREGLRLDDVALVIGPQRSTEFSSSLAEELSLPAGRLLVLDGEADYFTSSLAYSFARARRGRLTPGTVVLIIEAAAGLQVGCALYRI